MKNARAVYTSKPSLNGGRLADLALADGIQLRFMAMGGYIPSNAAEIQKKALTAVNGGALLIVGTIDDAGASIAEFGPPARLPQKMLHPLCGSVSINGGRCVCWCLSHLA